MNSTRIEIEKRLGYLITRQWILDGAGPARYGWAAIEPCRLRYLGRTLAEARDSLYLEDLEEFDGGREEAVARG
jgi:hypothetical protein